MACLPRPVIIKIWSQPEAIASSTPYWMIGLSTSGSISLGWALVAGRKRVPRPAAGNTALRTFIVIAVAGRFRFHHGLGDSTLSNHRSNLGWNTEEHLMQGQPPKPALSGVE